MSPFALLSHSQLPLGVCWCCLCLALESMVDRHERTLLPLKMLYHNPQHSSRSGIIVARTLHNSISQLVVCVPLVVQEEVLEPHWQPSKTPSSRPEAPNSGRNLILTGRALGHDVCMLKKFLPPALSLLQVLGASCPRHDLLLPIVH